VKKILVIAGLCILAGYLIFAALYFKDKPYEEVCSDFTVTTISKNNGASMIDIAEIEKLIDKNGLNPYGKALKNVNSYEIEQVILQNKMVKKASVFITNNGGVRLEIEERKPILRIMDNAGNNYYIDDEGEQVPLSDLFVADLPLATGNISIDYAKTQLHEFAKFLYKNEFWNNQIEQIVVSANEEVKIIPRIGNHEIIMGKLNNFEDKLAKLKVFYDKGLSEVGWNRYSAINLKFDKQVVATKR